MTVPILPVTPPFIVEYATATSMPANINVPVSFNRGGICTNTTSPCFDVQFPGPVATGGVITCGPGPIGPVSYTWTIEIDDISLIAGSYYYLTVDDVLIGNTPIVTFGGGTKSTGSFNVTFNDGPNPGTHTVGVTNGYLGNTASPAFINSEFSMGITQATTNRSPSVTGVHGSAGIGTITTASLNKPRSFALVY